MRHTVQPAADAGGLPARRADELAGYLTCSYRIELAEWPSGHPDGIAAADLS